jgi:cell division transport system permease protein
MLGSLGFLLHEAWLNMRRQALMALTCVATAAVSLTIFAVFVLLAWHVHSWASALPRRFEVHAFTRASAPREETEALVERVKKLPGVATVRLVPKEQAWAEFRKSYPRQEDFAGLSENPLPDKLEIQAVRPEETLTVAEAVRVLPGIERVNEGKETVRRLLAVASVARAIGIGVAVLLALGTAAIVGNAIRLTLFARRRDIQVMQSVGATDDFIRFPFVLEGIVQGLLGGLVACVAVGATLQYVGTKVLPNLAFMNEFRITLDVPLFCASLVIGGALLGLFGSLFSLRKFLRPA